jgi:hypothetical protein
MVKKAMIQDSSKKEGLISRIKILIAGTAATAGAVNPVAGVIAGILGTAICESLPDFKKKNQEEFLKQFSQQIYAEIEKIDVEFMKKEEFTYMLNKCLKAALDEIDNAKRKAYINILANLCISPDSFDEIEFYSSLLNSLSSLEVHLLAFYNNPEGYLEIRGIDKSTVNGGYLEVLKKSFPRLSQEELELACKSLFNRGLTNTEIVRALTASQGLELIRGRLTNGGKKLIEYASDYNNKL